MKKNLSEILLPVNGTRKTAPRAAFQKLHCFVNPTHTLVRFCTTYNLKMKNKQSPALKSLDA